jgi:hypothetical protein
LMLLKSLKIFFSGNSLGNNIFLLIYAQEN